MKVNSNQIIRSNPQEDNTVNQPQAEGSKIQGKTDNINNFSLSIKERIGLWELQTTGSSAPKKVIHLKNDDLAKQNLQKLLDEFDPNENPEPNTKKKEKPALEEVVYKALIQPALNMEEPSLAPLVDDPEFKIFNSTLASLEEELTNVTFDEPKVSQVQEKMETHVETELLNNNDHSNQTSEEVDLQARLNALEALANYTVDNLSNSDKTSQSPEAEDLSAKFEALEEYANLTMENLNGSDKIKEEKDNLEDLFKKHNVSPLEDERRGASSKKPKRKRIFSNTPVGIDPIAEKKLWRKGVFLGKGDLSNTSIEKTPSHDNNAEITSSANASATKKSRFSLTRFLRKAAKNANKCWENMTLPKKDTKRALHREVALLKTTPRKDGISE